MRSAALISQVRKTTSENVRIFSGLCCLHLCSPSMRKALPTVFSQMSQFNEPKDLRGSWYSFTLSSNHTLCGWHANEVMVLLLGSRGPAPDSPPVFSSGHGMSRCTLSLRSADR